MSIVSEWNRAGIRTPRGNQWRTNSLGHVMSNARNCGWRELDGELVRGDDGEPVVGDWTAIITPDKWMAIRAMDDARRGKRVDQKGNPVADLPEDHRDPSHLLTGIVRCGKVKPNGKVCNMPLRVRPDGKVFRYACKAPSAGGCSGVARRGDLVDYFISELVLTKMGEADFSAAEVGDWPGETEYRATSDQLDVLTDQWMKKQVTNDRYFRILPRLEADVARLRAERERFVAARELQERKKRDRRRRDSAALVPPRTGGRPSPLAETCLHPRGTARGDHPSKWPPWPARPVQSRSAGTNLARVT